MNYPRFVQMRSLRTGGEMTKYALLLLLLAGTAHGEAVVSLPATGPTITRVGQTFDIPVTITNFVPPPDTGAQWLGVNVLPSPGLTIHHVLIIGPWTISGNPTNYYGWHNYYVDLWHMVASLINNDGNGCITQPEGIAFWLRVTVNSYWTGGQESLTFGRSIKEVGPTPGLTACSDQVLGGEPLPARYGNTLCVLPIVTGEPPNGGGSGTCHAPYCETAATAARKTTWGRLKSMYR
jgi:hypothetical protein